MLRKWLILWFINEDYKTWLICAPPFFATFLPLNFRKLSILLFYLNAIHLVNLSCSSFLLFHRYWIAGVLIVY